MNIYNNKGKSTRSAPSCSYCADKNHNVSNCPRVAEDYAWFSKSPPVIPLGVSKTTNTCHWYKTPKYWGDWYNNCMNAYDKQQQAKKKASLPPTRRPRSAPKCGFCGSTKHKRPRCIDMSDYLDRAHKANQNWRRAFHQTFVDELGISEGALLTIKKTQGYGNEQPEEVIGVVTSINWDELSMFCSEAVSSRGHSKMQYKQKLKVKVLVDGEEYYVFFGYNGINTVYQGVDKKLVSYSQCTRGWSTLYFDSVIARSEACKGAEWIEEGHRKSLEFLVKKCSLATLDNDGVTDLINDWA